MKNNKILYSVLFSISLALIVCSCQKISHEKMSTNTDQNFGDYDVLQKLKPKVGIGLEVSAGHLESQCNAQGLCFRYGPFGVASVHIPCQAEGDRCKWKFDVSLSSIKDVSFNEPQDLELEIKNFGGDFFLMPARSIPIVLNSKKKFINFPEQILNKTSIGSYQSVGVRITETAVYN